MKKKLKKEKERNAKGPPVLIMMQSLLVWREATVTPRTWRNRHGSVRTSSSGKSIEQSKRAATAVVAISKLLEEPRSKKNRLYIEHFTNLLN